MDRFMDEYCKGFHLGVQKEAGSWDDFKFFLSNTVPGGFQRLKEDMRVGPGTAYGASGGAAAGVLSGLLFPGRTKKKDEISGIGYTKNPIHTALLRGLMYGGLGGLAGFGIDNRHIPRDLLA